MIQGLITQDDIAALNAARTVLERIDQECKHEHQRSAADHHEAFVLGKVGEAADAAGDAIFNVLNVARSWAHVEIPRELMLNDPDAGPEPEGPA